MQRLRERNPNGKIVRWISLTNRNDAPRLSETAEASAPAPDSTNIIPFAPRTSEYRTSGAAA